MTYKLTITPIQKDLPHLRCLFSIEGDDFYMSQYMNGTEENRRKWELMVKSLNDASQ